MIKELAQSFQDKCLYFEINDHETTLRDFDVEIESIRRVLFRNNKENIWLNDRMTTKNIDFANFLQSTSTFYTSIESNVLKEVPLVKANQFLEGPYQSCQKVF